MLWCWYYAGAFLAQIAFQFYGVSVVVSDISAGFPNILADLSEDFNYFISKIPIERPFLKIQLVGSPWVRKNNGKNLFFKTQHFRAYGWGRERIVDYLDEHHIVSQNYQNQRDFQVYGISEKRLHELTFLLILSAVGEELEARGYQRLHALAFETPKTVCIALLASGLGKSTLAYLLMKDPKIKIFSDEIALIHEAKLLPFPLRQALRPESVQYLGTDTAQGRLFKRKYYSEKWLFSIDSQKIAEPRKPNAFVFGTAGTKAFLKPGLNTVSAFVCLRDIVFGVGLPQMSEHLLRPLNFFRLMEFGIKRLKLAWFLSKNCKIFHLSASKDPHENMKLFYEVFMDKYSDK